VKMIVGLGNPGDEYNNTRHNVGYLVVDRYTDENKWKNKFNALYTEKNIFNNKVLFIKPTTYMNLSGDAVVKFVNYFDISLDDILIIHDDLDLEFGNFKLKKNSGPGGHNGIKSIINRLNSQDFARLKIGISNNKKIDTKDYVLGNFSKNEQQELLNNQPKYNEIIDSFIKNGIEKTMNIYNTKEK